MSGGKFKININIDMLKDILEVAGKPISTKPVIEEGEKKKMFKNFLEDNFLDI
jgi:vacuolar-type H+-ATPase subunit B/Vma2